MKPISLELAAQITSQVEQTWISGDLLKEVSETTSTLLKYWFDISYQESRIINFHEGQKKSILNAIYLHEVLKIESVFDIYQQIYPELLAEKGLKVNDLAKKKHNHPKYCIKMATGTGKTWVLQALLIWQYLNAKNEEGNFSKNFLVVAPGLIVYQRLLDAFLGKENSKGSRDFTTSDLYSFQELFIPDEFRDEVFGFVQSSVANKKEIGSKVTGDGIIAITNYHLLAGVEDQIFENQMTDNLDFENPSVVSELVKNTLPIRPGKKKGNILQNLDNKYNDKKELDYLKGLNDLVVFNDEAHHIHEVKTKSQVTEVEWQKSLTYIAETKQKKFIQIDFSATPYNQVGNEKDYFPHIISDFDLITAISKGYVKTIALDLRKELATQPNEEINFKAIRDENNNVIGLSKGQRLMLRAGLEKLNILEESFGLLSAEKNKYPKMMVVCEDTSVVPLVFKFFQDEGLSEEDVLEIHSNKKGEVGDVEWEKIRSKLFSIDKQRTPRVVVSVLMLREGFDVNNICVIVPLRSSQSGILLEQTIGRGLRIMWREPEFRERKEENRKRLLIDHLNPVNYFDILSIVEHPAFKQFYEELISGGAAGIIEEGVKGGTDVVDDFVTSELKSDFERFDFEFPIIIQEPEEVLKKSEIDYTKLQSYSFSFDQMKKAIKPGEQFSSEEMINKTRFGDYSVESGVMTASSYNDFLSRVVKKISERLMEPVTRKAFRKNPFPHIQVELHQMARLVDNYVRYQLFQQEVDYFDDENWRVLLHEEVINHITKAISRKVHDLEQTELVGGYEVFNRKLSEVKIFTVRESKSIQTRKTIYTHTPYPLSKGGLEKAFIEYCDHDGNVDAFVKVIEHKHTFARLRYAREDGMMSFYYPDFLVRCGNKIFMVETKGQDRLTHPNVNRKKISAVNWIEKINKLHPDQRGRATWSYVLLGENRFYSMRNRNANILEMLESIELKSVEARTELF